MRYENVVYGTFQKRINRFVAEVLIDGKIETVHVKNTGRCRELLLPAAEVSLMKSSNPQRKTAYDLIAVQKPGLGWVNIDSQVCNTVVKEWLEQQDYQVIQPEYTFGASRFDFYMEKNGEKYLLEVKGCTLEREGIGYFPDAPTARGVKHLKELIAAQKLGYHCSLAFVIAMPKVSMVLPNTATDPSFAAALNKAMQAGVSVVMLQCYTSPYEIYVKQSS